MSPEATKVWTRLRPDLPWLSVIDLDVFSAYCANHARWREAEDFLKKNGLTFQVFDDEGEIKFVQQWPEVNIAQKCLVMLVKLGGELGLSPASRTRIQVAPEKKKSDDTSERMFG